MKNLFILVCLLFAPCVSGASCDQHLKSIETELKEHGERITKLEDELKYNCSKDYASSGVIPENTKNYKRSDSAKYLEGENSARKHVFKSSDNLKSSIVLVVSETRRYDISEFFYDKSIRDYVEYKRENVELVVVRLLENDCGKFGKETYLIEKSEIISKL